jgi:hypothetical protein
MTKYKEITNEIGHIVIERITEDGVVTWIPKDPANSDYQAYLNPEAEQSTPMVSDEAKTK